MIPKFIKDIATSALGLIFVFAIFGAVYLSFHYIGQVFEAPLMKAVKSQNLSKIEKLLEEGADANAGRDLKPLHYAAEHGPTEIVILLLTHGANPNSRTKYKVTPLHYAAQGGNIVIAKLLIKFGARVEATDDQGKTPLDWINGKEWASPSMVALLQFESYKLQRWP
ncbi:ankyrin repeat domain-containing protein [Syntrophus aciditrophicus]|uniref:Hypothetical membrane protein n=1 Tax=Syntrophus aciditrophicus (strain SB) TaxID=56780 RepID=Q2LSH9_SYNAS|nr:ankyrin repeat domain-containing protein [Syntrophus aciditrophicus]ABC77043.1 hypothetical membrane protein [Syntrophus aciditrophicus SB]